MVTAFDYFKVPGLGAGNFHLIGLNTINDRAAGLIGDRLLGCVRYGSEGWSEEFNAFLLEATRE